MSKRHHKKQQRKNSLTVQSKTQTSSSKVGWLNFIKKLLGRFWGIIAVISVTVSLFFFLPRLTIIPGEPADKLNPFYTPFVLSNDGYVSIENIKFKCGLKKVNLKGNNLIKNSTVELSNMLVPSLGASESTSIRFNHVFNKEAPILSARIEVFVSYKTFLIPLNFKKKQQFETLPDSSGNLVWVPVAASIKEEE